MSQPAFVPVVVGAAAPGETAAASPEAWSLPKRVGFRFVFAYTALWLLPYPLTALPGTHWLDRANDWVWNGLTVAFGRALLHRTVETGGNGSGDTTAGWLQTALVLVLAVVATAIWSLADRRRPHYARLSRWLHAYLRFCVGGIMIGYGLAKVFHSQFPFPSPSKLEQPYGAASPMGLLWTFMGFSGPYNVFSGLAETVPAVLLFFRRTATLGALMLIAVMTNVVMLNLCYDVPVKIFSTQLLLASLYIAGPRLGALADLLVRGRAVAASPPSPLFARRRLDLAARVAGVLFGGYLLVHQTVDFVSRGRQNSAAQKASVGLQGRWLVDRETRDGKPVAADEPTRWVRFGLGVYKGSVRADYHRLDEFYDRLFFVHDSDKKTLTVDPEPGQPKATWSYAQPDNDHLIIHAIVDGKPRELTLHRATTQPTWRLTTRGFHWVNEAPYNR